MINLQWLELPMSRTNFHGPKDVREFWLYVDELGIKLATLDLQLDLLSAALYSLKAEYLYPQGWLIDCVGI